MDFSKENELKMLIREYVKEIVKEFTGVGAAPGYALPLGTKMDPESLSSSPKIVGLWKKQSKAKTKTKRKNTNYKK